MQKRYALLIGINGYHESLGGLSYAVNDTKLMQETLLAKPCGFTRDRIVLLSDDQDSDRVPTYGNIQSWLAAWLSRPEPQDLALVYFAGHGRELGGSAFIAPQDATMDSLPVTGIKIDLLRDMLERCKASQKVLILDACHSGAGRDVATMSATFRDSLDTAEGLYTIASCDKDQISHEWPEKEHGVFTYYLAEAIRDGARANAAGDVTLDAVYDWVRHSLLDWTAGRRVRQDPVRICRTRGSIAIAARPLTLEEKLRKAEEQISAQRETIARQQSELQRLQTTVESDEAADAYPFLSVTQRLHSPLLVKRWTWWGAAIAILALGIAISGHAWLNFLGRSYLPLVIAIPLVFFCIGVSCRVSRLDRSFDQIARIAAQRAPTGKIAPSESGLHYKGEKEFRPKAGELERVLQHAFLERSFRCVPEEAEVSVAAEDAEYFAGDYTVSLKVTDCANDELLWTGKVSIPQSRFKAGAFSR